MHCANPVRAVTFTQLAFKGLPTSRLTLFVLLCFRVEAEVNQAAAAELSEAAQCELMDQCEDQFTQLEKVNWAVLYHQSLGVQILRYKLRTVSVCVAASE